MLFDSSQIYRVGDVLREAAAAAILPRFQRLKAGEVREKSSNEIVTIADEEAEQIIANGLCIILPGSVVVGEEAASKSPHLLERVDAGDIVWLVDPLDGTKNFAEGKPEFAVMVALLEGGVALAAWILDPITNMLATAERGRGTYFEGVQTKPVERAVSVNSLRGIVATRFLPSDLSAYVTTRFDNFAEVTTGIPCAGHVYPDIIYGAIDFALFWRTLPWDHAPGALLVEEAGGRVSRLDGSVYRPGDGKNGLLVARSDAVWNAVSKILLQDAPHVLQQVTLT
jgi:fructose-1,6-bisphosphatase/inositol monophosphatase family enzyme